MVTDRMAVLECRVEAKPMPTFNWITPAGVTGFNVQSSVMDPQNNLIFISRLEFTRTALSGDAGQYSCTGFNVAGNFSQSATLTVLGETALFVFILYSLLEYTTFLAPRGISRQKYIICFPKGGFRCVALQMSVTHLYSMELIIIMEEIHRLPLSEKLLSLMIFASLVWRN